MVVPPLKVMDKKHEFCQRCGMNMRKNPEKGGARADGVAQSSMYCIYGHQYDHLLYSYRVIGYEFQDLCHRAMGGGSSKLVAWLCMRGMRRRLAWWKNSKQKI
jgi:hypothetical protein